MVRGGCWMCLGGRIGMPDSPFLEERISVAVEYGSAFGDDYEVLISQTAGGKEFRSLVHPWPRRHFMLNFLLEQESLWSDVVSLYHRAYGRYAGFRVRALDDFSTNGTMSPPTAFDQVLDDLGAWVYQLQKAYGLDSAVMLDIGRPVRTIFKPVAGTVRVGVVNALSGQAELSNTGLTRWTVDVTTGKVTMAANRTRAVTSISAAASAVIGVGSGHPFVVGDSVHVSGVVGMTQINGRRGAVTAIGASTITVGINSSGFTAWSSGGTVNTVPQAGEVVTGGCEFDIPCRFNARLDVLQNYPNLREAQSVELVELITL